MAPPQARTAEALLALPDDGFRYELVRGELLQMSPAGGEHSFLSHFIDHHLSCHVEQAGLGMVLGADAGFLLATDPDTVRGPDLAFISKTRVPAERPKGYWRLAPDLVAEVVSPNDRFAKVQEKITEWLDAGVRAVLLVDPTSRSVTVYWSSKHVEFFREGDVLEVDDVVPGWKLSIAELFSA